MAYRVYWHIPHQMLCMELEGNLTLDDFQNLDRAILALLGNEAPDRQLMLLVDITRPATTPRDFARLRASQTYLLRFDLKFILVAGSNKLMRLMMLLTFNLCRPSVRFFDNIDEALKIAQILNRAPARSETA